MEHNDPSSLVHVSNFSEDFRESNWGVPHKLSVLRCLSRTVGFGSSLRTLAVHSLFCFGLRSIDPWFMTCKDLIKLKNFQKFFGPTHTSPFLSDCQILLDPTRTNLFCMARSSCNIECMLVEEMLKDASISRYATWPSCTMHGINVLWFLDDLRLRAVFHSAIGWCFTAIQKFKFIDALFS